MRMAIKPSLVPALNKMLGELATTGCHLIPDPAYREEGHYLVARVKPSPSHPAIDKEAISQAWAHCIGYLFLADPVSSDIFVRFGGSPMNEYRVYYRDGYCTTKWMRIFADNALVAKQQVERAFWVVRADRPF